LSKQTEMRMAIGINGTDYAAPVDPRVSLLDFLREQAGLTGTKLGCNQGACGACTVLIDDERVLSCLTLAVQADGRKVRTIEGLSDAHGNLHPCRWPSSSTTDFSAATVLPARSVPLSRWPRKFDEVIQAK